MSRNNIYGSRSVVLEINKFNGQNTAASFSEIDITQSPKMLNLLPGANGSLKRRPGTLPISIAPTGPISRICNLRRGEENFLLVTNGNTLYRFDGVNFYGQQMTVNLNQPNIDSAQFKNDMGDEILVITDGGKLKGFNGSSVYEIGPAPNDESTLPANDLVNINTNHKPKGCLVHNTRVVIWDGSDTIWHSKIGTYNYFAQTDYQRFVRENDYVQTCVSYRSALIVFMRRHIGILFGHDIDNWSQDFLDTTDGCIAPKTVKTVIFPDGNQEVFYLSDHGVHSVYAIDTLSLDSSARYSTKSVSANSIDWHKLGVTKEEMKNAVASFYRGRYWLVMKRGSSYIGFVYDTTSKQWYPIDNIKANDFYDDEDGFYYVSDDGHVHKFDDTTYSDWNDINKTTGTSINSYWYSKMMTPKLTGYDHFWDILMVEAKQFPITSTIDVEVNTYRDQYSVPSALKTAIFVWGQTQWGESQWHNEKLTDPVNHAKRLRTFIKGLYAQVKLSNDRNEPIEIYGMRYEVRVMDKYS